MLSAGVDLVTNTVQRIFSASHKGKATICLGKSSTKNGIGSEILYLEPMDVLMKSKRDYTSCNFFYVTSCHCNAKLLPWQNLMQNVGMSLTKATNISRHISAVSIHLFCSESASGFRFHCILKKKPNQNKNPPPPINKIPVIIFIFLRL